MHYFTNSEGEEGQAEKKLYEKDPELYGIRRSNRKRPSTESKPPKLVPQVSKPSKKSSSSSKKPSAPGSSRKRKLSSDDDDDESSSDEEVTR